MLLWASDVTDQTMTIAIIVNNNKKHSLARLVLVVADKDLRHIAACAKQQLVAASGVLVKVACDIVHLQ